MANVFQSYSVANMVDVLWCFKKTFFFDSKAGKKKAVTNKESGWY